MDKQRKTILLHICCAPCAIWLVDFFQEEDFKVIGFFYNPNIHGEREYRARFRDAETLAKKLNFDLEVPEYNVEDYFSAIYRFEKQHHRKIEGNSKLRCPVCYNLRLEQSAQYAKKIKADYFSTSLLISPYQRQSIIWQIGTDLGKKYGVPFYFRDWRKNYWESTHRAKKLNFYLPKYCGCVYSLKEKKNKQKL